jgi:hypothetical protein
MVLVLGLVACSNGQGNPGSDAGGGGNDARVPGEDAYVAVDSSHDVGLDSDPVPCDTEDVGSIWGRLYDQETFDPIVGATVCVVNQPQLPCDTTDEAGGYAIACVPSGDAELSYEAAGYPRALWAWSSRYGINEDVNLGLQTAAHMAEFLAPTSQAYPDGARSFVTIDFIGAADGATVALRSGTGAGPFYTRYMGGTLDPSITSITSADEYAYFLGAAASGGDELEITVTPGSSGTTCGQYYGGWTAADGTPNTMRIPVEPDGVSVIFVICE